MNDRVRLLPTSAIAFVAALCLAWLALAGVARGASSDAALYRIFLNDGSTLVSYGEFARVGDRVVFSMPLGAVDPDRVPALQLVTLPAALVDWTETDRYAASTRAARYVATRGEADFAVLSSQVAWALNEIALTTDPARRLDLARRAQRVLNEWARMSYGYRARDGAELGALVDEVISGLRAASGADRFELTFVATVAPPATVPLLPPPTLRESIEQALRAARVTDDPTGRIQLLRSAVKLVDEPSSDLPESWAGPARARAAAELTAELRVERSYTDLRTKALRAATARAQAADVRGLEALVRHVLAKDDELGRRRPNAVSALLTTLDAKVEAARRLRLARDQWTIEIGAFRTYRKRASRALDAWARVKPALEDVRSLAGPDPKTLARVEARLGEASLRLSLVGVPAALRPVHALFVSAFQLAASAARLRQSAAARGDMRAAWNASAAAAGALMLFERATRDLQQALTPPELP